MPFVAKIWIDVAGEERTTLENYCSARRKHLGEYFVERMAMEGYILKGVMQKGRQYSKEYMDSDRDCWWVTKGGGGALIWVLSLPKDIGK